MCAERHGHRIHFASNLPAGHLASLIVQEKRQVARSTSYDIKSKGTLTLLVKSAVVQQHVTLANNQQTVNYAVYNGHGTVTSHASLCPAVDCMCHSCVIKDGGQLSDWERTWSATEQDLNRVGRAVFVEVDLDALADNCNILRSMCRNKNIGVIGVVKGNAYGHGVVPVARYLKQTGAIDRLAVANIAEGVQLRQAGICGIIHVLGNVQSWEMPRCIRYRLVPTVTSEAAIRGMAEALKTTPRDRQMDDFCCPDDNWSSASGQLAARMCTKQCCVPLGTVHIKVDTGMSRNGCQPNELPQLVQACHTYGVPLEGIFSHISHHEDPQYSKYQLDMFTECIEPYRNDGYLFHIANSGAILYDIGTDMDLVRPGISLYGMPSGPDTAAFVEMGFRPALSVRGTPTLVKRCKAGTKVGYACAYTCTEDEWIASFPIGYADGLWREFGDIGTYIIRDKTGEHCPIVGRISMDSITVRLSCRPADRELFTIITADFDPVTSVTGIADTVGTIQNEVLIRIATRLPRVYRLASGHAISVLDALDLVRSDNDQLMAMRPGFGPSSRSMAPTRADLLWPPN